MNKPIKSKRMPYPNGRRSPIMKQAATKAKIRVQLDSRTIITIPDMEALKLWTPKYPAAKVLTTEANN